MTLKKLPYPQTVCILATPELGGNSGIGGGTTRRRSRRSLRPEAPKIEAQGRGRGGVLGEGRLAPSPPAKGSGGAL